MSQVKNVDDLETVRGELPYLFEYFPQKRKMMQKYDKRVYGIKSALVQKWLSRPHHGCHLTFASRMLDCESFTERFSFLVPRPSSSSSFVCSSPFPLSLSLLSPHLSPSLLLLSLSFPTSLSSPKKDHWIVYTNGLTDPLPLCMGGKRANTLCFDKVDNPSITIRYANERERRERERKCES